MSVSTHHVGWNPCWRVIPTKYAEKRVLGKLAIGKDLEAVEELERMTSERLRKSRGAPGNDYVMAAFSYRHPSRFSDGTYGVFYAAKTLETAIAEAKFHRQAFMSATKEAPMRLEQRALTAELDASLHDLRGKEEQYAHVYSKTSYTASQNLARELVEQSNGLVYDSVRDGGGECAAVFNPDAVGDCRPERSIVFEWDGKKIAMIYELHERRG